jgi:hypothetical protein
LNSESNYESEVPESIEVKYSDPRLRPLLNALNTVNRDSMGFGALDSNSRIIYKEEFKGTSVKLFFERPDFLTILYFDKSDKGVFYQREEETTKGPKKLFIKDVDGYKSEIQETITRIYDKNKDNLVGKTLLIKFLDVDKYPDKRPYKQDSSIFYPEVEYETEISIDQAKEVSARWRSAKQ